MKITMMDIIYDDFDDDDDDDELSPGRFVVGTVDLRENAKF